ncbi:MAG TPA: helix-turn-helix transcriptional regulator [Allosphingosinicella sp.]|nr:helix-turn-helix transcriptional regulator [Allosphingosinicella sp.]
MITRIREVRRARRMTLQDVADRCAPPTTPQTIGRLETGVRTVSMGWLTRIAEAMGVEAAELVTLPDRADVPLIATLGQEGAAAPRRETMALIPQAQPGTVALRVSSGVGDYRAGDEIWLERLAPAAFGRAMNRDLLVPRPGGRFLFGRLIGREEGKLHLLPLGAGQRQMVLAEPNWAAVAVQLLRAL